MRNGVHQLVAMARSLANQARVILGHTITGMTRIWMEGIDRKTKTMLRMFYGLRDVDLLRLKLYALHESKHKLVG